MLKRILIVDDHDVVRQGVRLILRAHPEWQVIDEAENGAEAVEKTKSLNPDLLILDISMPGKDGLEVIKELMAEKLNSKIVVLTMYDSKELATKVGSLGASGYVTKARAARDLVQAIRVIFSGGTFFPGEPGTGAAGIEDQPDGTAKSLA